MGYDNQVGGRRVGAGEKRATAKRIAARESSAIVSKGEGPKQGNLSSVIFVTAVSILLAWFVTQEKLMNGPGYHPTGLPGIDKFIAGRGVPDITGNKEQDFWLLVGLRGIVVAILAGLVPFFTWLFVLMTDRTRGSFYITCWGVSVMTLLAGYLAWNYIAPFLNNFFLLIMT